MPPLATCPTCGSTVRVVTEEEGTSHYVPHEPVADAAGPLKTATGHVLTDADIEALADEAERGYDVSQLVGSSDHEAREALLSVTVDGVIFDCRPAGDALTLKLKDRSYGIRLSARGRIAITLVSSSDAGAPNGPQYEIESDERLGIVRVIDTLNPNREVVFAGLPEDAREWIENPASRDAGNRQPARRRRGHAKDMEG